MTSEISRLLAFLPPGSIERQVFELAEIQRIPYKVIAARIGVSERHLYRLRRMMLDRLCAAQQHIGVSPVIPLPVQRLENARHEWKYGHAQRRGGAGGGEATAACAKNVFPRSLALIRPCITSR